MCRYMYLYVKKFRVNIYIILCRYMYLYVKIKFRVNYCILIIFNKMNLKFIIIYFCDSV